MKKTKTLTMFLCLAFGWAMLIGGLLYAFHIKLSSVGGIIIIGLLYMPAPAVAAYITEGRLVRSRLQFPKRSAPASISLKYFLLPVIAVLAAVTLLFSLTYLLGNLGHLSALGHFSTNIDALRHNLAVLFGPDKARTAKLPASIFPFLIVGVIGAIVAGWSLNGVLAMGEEYGWRGLLWEQLRGLGYVPANVVTGIIWGLWHAPLILQGYNFPGHPVLGIISMISFTTAVAFVLSAIRELTGSVIPAAATHGAINGIALFVNFMVAGRGLIGGVLGLSGDICFLLVGLLLWQKVNRQTKSVR